MKSFGEIGANFRILPEMVVSGVSIKSLPVASKFVCFEIIAQN